MPLDNFIPHYDFVERHKTLVRASPEATRHAIDEWPLSSDSIMRFLFRLRGLGRPRGQSMSLRHLLKANGFLILADNDSELIAGQIGRFWAVNERGALVSPKTADEFRAFNDPRYAVGVMDVRVEPVKRGTRLTTETRVRCLGPGARRRFRLYWFVIRPFSGLIRRRTLAGIKAHAEANSRKGDTRH